MRFVLLAALMAVSCDAHAQVPAMQAKMEAMGNRLLAEVDATIACDTDRVLMRARIADLENKLKAATDKAAAAAPKPKEGE